MHVFLIVFIPVFTLEIQLPSLTPATFVCAYPKPGPGFLALYAVVFIMFKDLRLDIVVRVVDIGGIGGHHC